ncbi:hypothetical protein [Brackiella oedipodis]|uniref:hypothetical protein n=1 Tax=Brackiella oedipodis TaxID=124225 RepID=UPI000686A576|nr:hypothetical protein [Brackiella oedipodis]
MSALASTCRFAATRFKSSFTPVLAGSLVALLSACTSHTPNKETVVTDTEPLVCHSNYQCTRYWSRAQQWISKHSPYKVQSVSDNEIRTFTPAFYSTAIAVKITKKAQSDGSYRIDFYPDCAGFGSCQPTKEEATADFKRYVRLADEAITIPEKSS